MQILLLLLAANKAKPPPSRKVLTLNLCLLPFTFLLLLLPDDFTLLGTTPIVAFWILLAYTVLDSISIYFYLKNGPRVKRSIGYYIKKHSLKSKKKKKKNLKNKTKVKKRFSKPAIKSLSNLDFEDIASKNKNP